MVARVLDSTTTFLSLISLIALIVGSLGVAMAMHSHLQQRMDTIAVMKAVGARSGQIMQIYLVQTLWLATAGALAGVGIGALVQRSFPWLIRQIFSLLPVVPWNWSFAGQGMVLGLLATLLFTVPPLLSVRSIRPNLLLRRNMAEGGAEKRMRWHDRAQSWTGALLILIGFAAIAVWVSGSWRTGVYFVTGLAVSVLVLAGISAALLALMRRVVKASGRNLPVAFRHGFANLYRPGNQARAVLMALGIGVMFTVATFLLQKSVLRQVKSEAPGKSGNVFLLDVRNPSEVTKLVESQPGVEGKVAFVGYITARMLDKNGVSIDKLPSRAGRENEPATVRITTARSMPEGLSLKQGRWWNPDSSVSELAVSERVQSDFHLKLRDMLRFQIAGQVVSAPVIAVFGRETRGPLRYEFVFPSSALQSLPVVYYGAVQVNPATIPELEEALFNRFPTVTVMNLADVLARIQEAVDQVALVIRFLAAFAIVAGLIILCSSVAGTRYGRIREVAILKTLGGTRGKIVSILSIEFLLLGAVAGTVGGILANVFARVISKKFLESSFDFDWPSLVVALIGTALLANAAGWGASAGILEKRPLEVLRDE